MDNIDGGSAPLTPGDNPENHPDVIPTAPASASTLSAADMELIRAIIAESMKAAIPQIMASLPQMAHAGAGVPRMQAGAGGSDPPRMMVAPANPYRPDTPDNDFIHGVKGKVKWALPSPTDGSLTYVVFDVESVTVDESVDTDDITNTSATGDQVILDGIRKISGAITFVYDSLHVFLVDPLPWKTRSFPALKILPDGMTEVYSFTALITGHSTGTGPKQGTCRVTCNYMSTGSITHATASQTTATPPLDS